MRVLRVFALCLVGAVSVSLFCLCLGAAESQPPAAKTPDLQQRVAALEEKVTQLEKKLDQVSSDHLLTVPPAIAPPYGTPRAPAAPLAPGVQLPPQAPQLPPGVPSNAIPRQFNGQTYYIVPLTKDVPSK